MTSAEGGHTPSDNEPTPCPTGTAAYEPIAYRGRDCERRVSEGGKDRDERNPFEIDRSRIIHSAGFRRLQGKTQVFATDQSDFFRTRLTHSLETAQIAKGIALRLGASPDICEAAALAHDIGHPPFGHRGENVLAALMKPCGGFEANAQNLRVLGFLEEKSGAYKGLNLTRAVLDAQFKYKNAWVKGADEKKFHYAEDELAGWLKEVEAGQSFECQIMTFADDIAYAVHDLEDGLHAGLITWERADDHRQEIKKIAAVAAAKDGLAMTDDDVSWSIEQVRTVLSPPEGRTISRSVSRKRKTSELINQFIQGTDRGERKGGEGLATDRYRFEMVTDGEVARRVHALKALSYVLLITDQTVHTLEARAEEVLRRLFIDFGKENSAKSYPEGQLRDLFEMGIATSKEARRRVACDYIAGMTDEYAQRMYRRLFTAERSALRDF